MFVFWHWMCNGVVWPNVICLKAPQKHQKYVANVLGLPQSRVVCKTKRIGGGFGGKETRSAIFAAAASVAAYCLRQPVKLVLDRDIDMMTTGQRHSFLGKYKVSGFKEYAFSISLLWHLFSSLFWQLSLMSDDWSLISSEQISWFVLDSWKACTCNSHALLKINLNAMC